MKDRDLPKPTERHLQLLEIHICNSILTVCPYKRSWMLLVHLMQDITFPRNPVLPINIHWQKRLKRADSSQRSQARASIRLWSLTPISLVLSATVLLHIPLWTCPLTFSSCPYLQLHTLIIHWIFLFLYMYISRNVRYGSRLMSELKLGLWLKVEYSNHLAVRKVRLLYHYYTDIH